MLKRLILFNFVWGLFLWQQSAYSTDMNTEKIELTLESAINRALILNRSIQNELDNVSNAQFSLIAAKSEFNFKFQPALFTDFTGDKGLGGGLLVTKKLPFGTSLSIDTSVQKKSGNYNSVLDVSLLQPLLKGSSLDYNLSVVKQSEYSERTAERGLFLTRVNIVLDTVSAVYNIILGKKILELHESSFKRVQGYEDLARIKQKRGFATALDVYRATIQLKQAETLRSNSLEQYLDTLDNLKIILAIPLEQEIDVSAPLTYDIVQVDELEAMKTALNNREDLKQYNDMISNLELHTKVARHNILPRLDLVVKYSINGTNSNIIDSFNADKGKVQVGLASSGDISRTVERMGYQQSLIALENSRRMLSLKEDEIKREVKNTIRNLIKLEKNIQSQKEQSHEASGKLELSKVKFSHGMADNFELIDSEIQYRQAEVAYISSVIDYIIGTYRLKSVLGILLDDYGFKKDKNR